MEKRALAVKVGCLLELKASVGGKQRDRRLERQVGFSMPYERIPVNL